MAKQRIYLDEDNKLVVETDNGVIKSDGATTSEIRGDFKISNKDVSKLLVLLNDCLVKGGELNLAEMSGLWPVVSYVVMGKEEFIEEINNTLRKLEEFNDKKQTEVEFRIKNDTDNKVKELINAYNNTRRWWERKIKND